MVPKCPCAGVWPPVELSYFTSTMSGILSIFTTLGNFCIILAITKDPFKRLRTPFMFFLVSLAVSDLLVGCITMPTSTVIYILEAQRTRKTCHIRIIHLSYFISANASIINLGALCLDRYFAIAYPMRYRCRITLRKCLLVSFFIWLLAFSLPMLYFVTGYITFLMIFAHTGVILTLGILIFTYFKVYKTLRFETEKFRNIEGSSSKNRDSSNDCEKEERENKQSLSDRERKVTKVFLTMLISFSICYIPVIVIIYILQFCPRCNCAFRYVLRDLQFLSALSNSTVNPFICMIRLEPFRKALSVILRIRKGRLEPYPNEQTSSNCQSGHYSLQDITTSP